MTERITQAMVSSTVLADINAAYAALARSQSELSSGKSILEPSDNPYGAGHAIELQSTLDGLASYAANAKDGTSWLNTATGSLAGIGQAVQRVRELVVEADNGTRNQGDREMIAGEVEQLTEAVKQDANVQYAGQYVFSGTLTSTPPYLSGEEDAYQGNAEKVTRAIGPSSTVTVNTDISSVLGSGQGAADGKLLDVLRTVAQHLRGGSAEDLQGLRTKDLGRIDSNVNALSVLETSVGATTDQLRMAESRITDLQNTATQALSNTEDANIAQVATEYSSQQAGYNAALHAGAQIVQMSLLDFLH
ncbi:MAG TPA: flagellar hook-associated protein FlgL [Solirubrobacteraceae bacterium]|jgi:flagellar hook-associated protein 3 FlgL|nr:flagellar hook-associated protein FlgL [Solirubrobacteraceae bacterium]